MIVCYNVGICDSLAIILMWLDLECSSFLYARCMAKWSPDDTIVETLITSFSSALIIMHLKYRQYIILFMLLAKEAGKQPRMNWVCLGEWHKVIEERSWTIDVFVTCRLPLTNQPMKHTVQEKKKCHRFIQHSKHLYIFVLLMQYIWKCIQIQWNIYI